MASQSKYFSDIVLPSVGLPEKPTYNLRETSQILGVHRTTLYRYKRQGKLRVSPANRVYSKELQSFFATVRI